MSSDQSAQHLSTAATTTIMIASVTLIFLLFIVALFLYLHSNKYWGANPAFSNTTTTNNSHQQTPPTLCRRGLDPDSIKSLSSFVLGPDDSKKGLECAVCLSDLSVGEKARLLPLCRHGFHVDCIDMWFQSHSTCPLCRGPVLLSDSTSVVQSIDVQSSTRVNATEPDPNQTTEPAQLLQGSSSSSAPVSSSKMAGELVIEVPRRMVDRFSTSASPLNLSSNASDEARSPSVLGLQSIRRILRGVGSPRSPRSSNSDVEQGNLVSKPATFS